jgi:hypothetical protein
MPSYQWIQHKGKRILYMDIASQTSAELIDIVERIKPVVVAEPPKSIRCLCSTTGGRFNQEITQVLKEFTKHNEPYIKITALVGVEGLQAIIYKGILLFSGRKNLVLKNSKEAALDWLAEQ